METSEPRVATWPTLAGHLEDHQDVPDAHMKQMHASREGSPEQQVFLSRTEESVPKPNDSATSTPVTLLVTLLISQQVLRENSLSTRANFPQASHAACSGGLCLDTPDGLAWPRDPRGPAAPRLTPGQSAPSHPELSRPWEAALWNRTCRPSAAQPQM